MFHCTSQTQNQCLANLIFKKWDNTSRLNFFYVYLNSALEKGSKNELRRHGRDGREKGPRGRGFNRSKPEIVQSQSVFSMGPANKLKTG